MTKEELEEEIIKLELMLSGNIMDDLDLKDRIHKLKMALNGVEPENMEFECIGCSG